MCARFSLATPAEDVAKLFGLDDAPEWTPRYNIAPTQDVLVVREKDGKRDTRLMRWGLVPSWAKDPKIGQKLINARSETVSERPAYRAAFERRRCLMPASGFFEWTDPPAGAPRAKGRKAPRQPYHFTLVDGATMAFASLWEPWRNPEGELLRTCTILTTEPNDLVRPFHDRMPAILPPAGFAAWLDVKTPSAEAFELLRPLPADVLQAYAVSPAMNSAAYESPDCIARV